MRRLAAAEGSGPPSYFSRNLDMLEASPLLENPRRSIHLILKEWAGLYIGLRPELLPPGSTQRRYINLNNPAAS